MIQPKDRETCSKIFRVLCSSSTVKWRLFLTKEKPRVFFFDLWYNYRVSMLQSTLRLALWIFDLAFCLLFKVTKNFSPNFVTKIAILVKNFLHIFIYKEEFFHSWGMPHMIPRHKFGSWEIDTCPGQRYPAFHLISFYCFRAFCIFFFFLLKMLFVCFLAFLTILWAFGSSKPKMLPHLLPSSSNHLPNSSRLCKTSIETLHSAFTPSNNSSHYFLPIHETHYVLLNFPLLPLLGFWSYI